MPEHERAPGHSSAAFGQPPSVKPPSVYTVHRTQPAVPRARAAPLPSPPLPVPLPAQVGPRSHTPPARVCHRRRARAPVRAV